MKKLTSFIILFFLGCIFSSCPREASTTYKTIKTVHVLLFSFDKNGMFPYLDDFNKNELGIGIYPDSVSERVEVAQSFPLGNEVYAMADPHQIIYTNAIESLNVITLCDFDTNHPAGSNMNDILLILNGMGKTTKININDLSSQELYLKFASTPQNDSLQFQITGKITDEGDFTAKTELIIF